MGSLKTLFKVGLALVVLAVVGIVALLGYGKSTAEQKLRSFFATTRNANAKVIQDELHPKLAEAADPERVALFVREIASRYGEFQSVKTNGFSFTDNLNNGVREQRYAGDMVFEKAEIPLKIGFVDGKLIAIEIDSKAKAIVKEVMDAISVVPADTAPYVKKAEALVRLAFSGDADKAFDMLADELQKQLGKGAFATGLKTLPHDVASVQLLSANARTGSKDRLDIFQETTFKSGAKMKSKVGFQFFGFNSGIMTIEIPVQ